MRFLKQALAVFMVLAMLIPALPTALFAIENTVTVYFNACGGIGEPDAITATMGTALVLPDGPSKDGMKFMGWSYSAEAAATGDSYLPPHMEIYVDTDVTFHACYAYRVELRKGLEGHGSESVVLYKFPAKELPLLHDKASIEKVYGMNSGNSDQRSFIEWNTTQNDTTSKGTGDAYRIAYTKNESAILYAIWGYPIQYNADGGTFPMTDDGIFLKYVCGFDDNNYQNPKTLYGNFDLPEGENTPVKEGCRLHTMSDGRVYYGLLYNNMNFYTTETAQQNLTIPPTGGKLPWSTFHTTTTKYGDTAIEFYSIWEPSITYKANGGEGQDIVEYVTFDWKGLHKYNNYIVQNNAFSKEGATFTGWNTKPDGSGRSYRVGYTMRTFSNANPIILYAQWSDGSYTDAVITKKSVRFDANGGANPPATQYKYSDSALTISDTIPVRPGYRFVGWGTSVYTTDVSYTPGSEYAVDKDLNLYAIWTECNDHVYQKTASTDSSCYLRGIDTYTCEICQMSYDKGREYFHDYDSVITTEPTCYSTGTMTYTCTLCPASYSSEIEAIDHVFTDYISNDDATCTEHGTKTAHCENDCGATDTVIDEGSMTEHNYGEWKVVLDPTYFEEGMKERICLTCQNPEKQSIPIKEYINPFSDVKDEYWYADEVAYCVKRGYVTGMTETTFVPTGNLTRAQFLIMLAKLSGNDMSKYEDKESPFEDVKIGSWYHKQVTWGAEKGYVAGTSATTFSPNANVTREQLATFLYRYASKNDIDITGKAELNGFTDADKLADYATDALSWAVDAKIISGVVKDDKTYLDPRGHATRAQTVVMFMYFDNFRT